MQYCLLILFICILKFDSFSQESLLHYKDSTNSSKFTEYILNSFGNNFQNYFSKACDAYKSEVRFLVSKNGEITDVIYIKRCI